MRCRGEAIARRGTVEVYKKGTWWERGRLVRIVGAAFVESGMRVSGRDNMGLADRRMRGGTVFN